MKFKVEEIKKKGNRISVVISHSYEDREVFNFPKEYLKDGYFVVKIKKALKNRYERESVKLEEEDKLEEFKGDYED